MSIFPRALLFPALLIFAVPAWTLSFPTGALRQDTPTDLAPHPQTSKTFNEFWTYQFWLTNGLQAQVNLSRVNFGSFKDPVCGGDLSLMGFRGKNFFVAREYKAQNFIFDSAKTKLSVHQKIFFQGAPPRTHRVYFSTTKNGISYLLDLTFENMIAGAVWGDGVFHLQDNQQVGLFLHIPKATVHGRIAINGDTLAVQGMAWMDHSYQTQFATRLLAAGYRYVSTAGNTEGGYFFQSGEGLFGYGLREAGGRLQLLQPVNLKISNSSSGTWISRGLEFDFANASASRFQVQVNRQQTSAYQELNFFEKAVAKNLMGGEILSYRGTGTLNDSLPALYSFTLVQH